jgi:integrase
MDTIRYQSGSLEKRKTSSGLCWFIRFRIPGSSQRPRVRLGLVADLPTKAAAQRASIGLRKTFNAHKEIGSIWTFSDAIDRYEREEIPQRYSTQRGYKQLHRIHIKPRWGEVAIADIDSMDVRAWLLAMDMSTRSLGHIHGQMRVLFRFAMLWKWIPATVNPMSLFSIPGSTKRARKPRTITPGQFVSLLNDQRDVSIRAMIVGAYCLGLRASELFGLKWSDFDFLGNKVHIKRAIVDGRVGGVKTERSEAPLPLPDIAAATFMALYQTTRFRKTEDWTFASPWQAGKAPYNSQHIQFRILRPAGEKLGITFNLGWHTFRHSFKNLLKASGADPEMMRDLMRHSDTHITMNTYGESDFDRMRVASNRAMEMIFLAEEKK